ncbi:DnaB-like helicase C-terminal domain-containing protein, partial [Bacillus mycoides]|uniref:DnaB-like helicase C-terminal domain-containing protein n=1 Tax=Bacillus mycoides TaxID=1405 RepID=UPI003CC80E19
MLPPPPSLAKTTFSLNIPQNLPTKTHQSLPIFTLHIPPHHLVIPILSPQPNIHPQTLPTPSLTSHHSPKFTIPIPTLSNPRIYIHHTPPIPLTQIPPKSPTLNQEQALAMILIHYLHLIQRTRKSPENR